MIVLWSKASKLVFMLTSCLMNRKHKDHLSLGLFPVKGAWSDFSEWGVLFKWYVITQEILSFKVHLNRSNHFDTWKDYVYCLSYCVSLTTVTISSHISLISSKRFPVFSCKIHQGQWEKYELYINRIRWQPGSLHKMYMMKKKVKSKIFPLPSHLVVLL